MDSSFVEAIIEAAKPTFTEKHGLSYANRKFVPILPPQATELTVHNLTSLVDYCGAELNESKNYIIVVDSPSQVSLYTDLNFITRSRECLLVARMQMEQFNFGREIEAEQFIIKLQSQFVQDETTSAILRMIGNINEETSAKTQDDGTTQTVRVKQGIVKEGWEAVPNPVELAPFRTFAEVAQPASNFVLRVSKGPYAALYEADGGAWKNEATDSIGSFLVEQIVNKDNITILA